MAVKKKLDQYLVYIHIYYFNIFCHQWCKLPYTNKQHHQTPPTVYPKEERTKDQRTKAREKPRE